MKEQIDELVKLAKEYVEYVEEIGNIAEFELKDGWTDLRETADSSKAIRIYKRTESVYEKIWSVVFWRIEILLYSERIEFPYAYDAYKLEEIYYDARYFLTNLKHEISLSRKKIDAEKAEKMKRIAELERALKNLKEQL